MSNTDLDRLEALARAAEQMFTGMHWYTRFQILDGIGNDEAAALIGALDPDTVLALISLARRASPQPVAVDEQAREIARLRTALEDIAQPADAGCGCSFPCRCNTPEAEAINAEAMRDIASAALTQHPSAAPSGDARELLRKLVESNVGQRTLWQLSEGIGNEHPEGKAWLAAKELVEGSAAPSAQIADASKAAHWFGCLQKCAKLLGLPDDEPIPSGVVAAVEKLLAGKAQIADDHAGDERPEKPFAGPGAWFSVDILGNPMRQYAPGKWENAIWPSTQHPSVPVQEQSDKVDEQPFEQWWVTDGQYIRAGGGDYEKSFAYGAWQAALAQQSCPPVQAGAPEFANEQDLITFLDNLYECNENGAIHNLKWAPAQCAVAAIKRHALPAEPKKAVSSMDRAELQVEVFELRAALAERSAQAGAPGLLNAEELVALRRFNECALDGEGYDVPKEMMQRLAEIGVVRRKSGAYYEHTDYGLAVLEGSQQVGISELVNRFLAWPLPASLTSAMHMNIERPIGTHLMNADEARAMFEHCLAGDAPIPAHPAQDGEDARDASLLAQNELLRRVYDAAGKLIKAKGRYHTEQNYSALVAAYDLAKPAATQQGEKK